MSTDVPSHARATQEGDLQLLKSLLFRGPIERYALAQTYAEAFQLDIESADRRARSDIELARTSTDWGALIVANPYRLAMTAEELSAYLEPERRRGLSIWRRYYRQKQRGLEYLKAQPLRQGRMDL